MLTNVHCFFIYLVTFFLGRRLSAGDEEGGIDDKGEFCHEEVDPPGGRVSSEDEDDGEDDDEGDSLQRG